MCDIHSIGNQCIFPSFARDLLAKTKVKTIFFIGYHQIRDIVRFLQDDRWEDIYDKQYLTYKGNPITAFKSVTNSFCHNTYKQSVSHSLYNFVFNHDYEFDEKEQAILNYDFVVEQHNKKIKASKEMFVSDRPLIFIHFVRNSYDPNMPDKTSAIDTESLKTFIQWFSTTYPNKRFYVYIFTDLPQYREFDVRQSTQDSIDNKHAFILDLNEWSLDNFASRKIQDRYQFYKEMYTKFYDAVKLCSLEEHFPTFEETVYVKTVDFTKL